MDIQSIKDRMLGCLYGQAIGDALGFASEAMTKEDVRHNYPKGISKYNDIIQDDRRKGWPIGFWTDDTEMMLLILDSIVEDNSINLLTLAKKFLDWYDVMGYKVCGILTKKALNFAPPIYAKDPISIAKLVWDLKGRDSAPNGGLMRTSIVGLWPNVSVSKNAADICKMTHYDPRCVASCVVASEIIYNMVWKGTLLSKDEIFSIGKQYDSRIDEWIELAYNNYEISALELDAKGSDAYTYRTLAAALWCYWHAESFESGLLSVVNEGGDADTNGAIACAILGAKYGFDTIPRYYIDNLHNEIEYRQRVNGFIALAINEKE